MRELVLDAPWIQVAPAVALMVMAAALLYRIDRGNRHIHGGIRALLGVLRAAVLALLGAGGRSGAAPIAGAREALSNPLPQALALTAIVISFGLTLFLLALAGRQQLLTGDDLVEDDLEDRRIAEAPDPGALQ